jgi:hypothetical protein
VPIEKQIGRAEEIVMARPVTESEVERMKRKQWRSVVDANNRRAERFMRLAQQAPDENLRQSRMARAHEAAATVAEYEMKLRNLPN